MSEEDFVKVLIDAGWGEEEARNEAHEQYCGADGDCDGDMSL